MDTKWNNLIDKVFGFCVKKRNILFGIALILVGGYLTYLMFWEGYFYPYASGLKWTLYSIFENVSLGLGFGLILREKLIKKYGDWNPKEESIYLEWRRELFTLTKKFCGIFAVAFLIGVGINVFGYWEFLWIQSTVLVQFLICQVIILRFMGKKLDVFMEEREEINKRKIQEVLEIEKQSLEKVSRSDKLRMDLITNVSHDLKTPLTSMIGYVELLKKEELGDVARDYVDVISDKTDKLKEMIDSLFSLAKANSGNVELHMEKFEVNRLLEQILADMKDKIDESDLHFVKQLTKANTEITSDNMYFYRICQNLVENALKYSAKGTRVFVKTFEKDNEKLCIEITNTAGYFMDFEKEEILERFARGDKARSTEGNGLGLAIVSSYAKALGGEFDIDIDCDQFKAYLVFSRVKNS